MKILIVEDDFVSRRLLTDILTPYGDCDIAIDGNEAVEAFRLSWEDNKPYNLICMDIMMPNVDGQEALEKIREFEKAEGVKPVHEVKVIMISALDAPTNVVSAYYRGGATSYIVKPIVEEDLLQEMMNLGLIG